MIKTIIYIAMIGLLASCSSPKKSEGELWSVRMTDSEMKRYPEPWMIEGKTQPMWGYTHGLVTKAMLEAWKHTGDIRYYDYAKIYADSLIDINGKIKTMKFLSFNIDNINGGKILFDFYKQTNDARYKIAMDTLCKQMQEQPRTDSGGFWHKLRYPHQMWLDGIFMASPYLAQYGTTFGDTTLFSEVVHQITLIAEKTYDPATGLYYHGWDESKEQRWADKESGCSPNFWGRSIGWYTMALVDVLEYLPEQTNGRDTILGMVEKLADTLIKYQDEDSGVWYQVLDQGNRKGNYLESSASSMFVYFYAKAINKGYISSDYKSKLDKAFEGVIKQFIKQEKDGTYTITNCCAVAGLGGDKVYRDGSYEYYISEPIIDNDPKSVGSFILAAIEYEKLNK